MYLAYNRKYKMVQERLQDEQDYGETMCFRFLERKCVGTSCCRDLRFVLRTIDSLQQKSNQFTFYIMLAKGFAYAYTYSK